MSNQSPIRFDPRDKGEVYRPDKTVKRPSKATKSKRDFRKILDDDAESGEERKMVGERKENVKQRDPKLAKQPKETLQEGPKSLFDLSKEAASKAKTGSAEFTQEQPDIAAIAPHRAEGQAVQGTVPTEKPASTEQVYRLITEIVDKVSVMQKEGKNETIIELKGSETFKGARVVITNYPTAPKELNITIEGLTQAGKAVMDSQENRDALRSALDKQGIVVHQLQMTTVTESRIAAGETSDRDREGAAEEEKGGEQEQSSEEKEE